MNFFREQQAQWNSTNSPTLRKTLYDDFLEEFKTKLGYLEKHLLYHFLFSSPTLISPHAKDKMVQWMELIRQSEFARINTLLSLNEQNLNHHIVQLNQVVHKLILLYFVSYCMDYTHYTLFLESEIQKFYTRIELMEHVLWKQFLYPLGEPEYIDYHPVI